MLVKTLPCRNVVSEIFAYCIERNKIHVEITIRLSDRLLQKSSKNWIEFYMIRTFPLLLGCYLDIKSQQFTSTLIEDLLSMKISLFPISHR